MVYTAGRTHSLGDGSCDLGTCMYKGINEHSLSAAVYVH